MAVNPEDLVPEKQLRESYRKHAVRAQLHRWWQHYENPEAGLQNQLDVLDENIVVQSIAGDAHGHDEFAEAVLQLPSDWQNGHLLTNCTVDLDDDDGISLSVDLDYYNVGMLPDDGVSKSTVSYIAEMQPTDQILPKFTKISITQNDQKAVTEFRDAFVENRMRSLVHYFTALVENPARDPEPFREVLTSQFSFHYTDDPINTVEKLTAWVTGPLSSVIASEHVINEVKIEPLGASRYALTVKMKSQAMFPDKSGIISKNNQTWTVHDTLSDRFPRIEKITIDRDDVQRF